jgi:hypothetical protein
MSMSFHRKNGDVAQRFAERRQRENEAQRLEDAVPGLLTLRLEIEERSELLQLKHVRHFVVGRAPALFVIRCTDPACREGVHDITGAVMRGLREHRTSFQGADEGCSGTVGSQQSPCRRVLHFEAVATYAA